ncbi:hypothetical protein [Paenarthrobacter sp. NPDC018779]|uniref:hypothetical protein n=1 Tax=Paenarthrobacter sp. NPDC018779 TaxID=3364375 RepID=UPI0037C7FB29
MNQQQRPEDPTSPAPQGTTQPGGTRPSAGWGAPPSDPSAAENGWGAPASNTNGWGAPPANGWGTSLPGKDKGTLLSRWTLKRTLIVAGVAVVVAAGTAAGFYSLGNAGSADAANLPLGQSGGLGAQQGVPGQGLGPGGTSQDGSGQSGTGQSGTGQSGMGMPGQMGGMSPDGLGMAGGLNTAIHSEYVVLRDNEYVTMADQLGTVSEVSSNSLTVKSSDGFTKTYVLSSDTAVAQGTRQRGSTTSSLTIADIKSGAKVRVTATKDGDNYTAASVRLTTATTSSGQGSTSGSGTTS